MLAIRGTRLKTRQKLSWAQHVQYVKKDVSADVSGRLEAAFQKRTKGWAHNKLTFYPRAEEVAGDFYLYVMPAGEDLRYWHWVSVTGSPARTIPNVVGRQYMTHKFEKQYYFQRVYNFNVSAAKIMGKGGGVPQKLLLFEKIVHTQTGPHTVKMVFPWQGRGQSYTPHTTTGRPAGFGGTGEKHGAEYHRVLFVDYPGYEPRMFELDIMAEVLPEFRRVVHNALRRLTYRGY